MTRARGPEAYPREKCHRPLSQRRRWPVQVAVAADHAGFAMKQTLVAWLEKEGHQVENLGPPRPDPVDDYPDVA
ncbi:MAG: RpiB/LacA/LacB family sugar-phosphate isomerase, partial [Acidobacteria bacterium]|nr:RpiB/LacA/LacB family sugar-phosphate isomerase [Acidobacteriota bacterium]